MRLILVGPPGSGKGTQAKLLSKRHNVVHIGTGDILREAVRQDTSLGRKARPYLVGGQLVPDDIVNEVVADRFRREDRPTQFVIEGYPRTLAQANSFEQVLRQQFLDLTAVLQLQVDDDEIVRRMSGRVSCPNCKSTYHSANNPPRNPGICDACGSGLIQREDDRALTVRERLRLYHANTRDLVDHYRNLGLLHEIPAVGGIEEIYKKVCSVISKANSRC